MIRAISNYFASIPPVFIDGWIYAAIAFFGAWAAAFASDEAAKYIRDVWLFWLRSGCASVSASLLAIKMFRSTSYADHQEQKKTATTFLTRPAP